MAVKTIKFLLLCGLVIFFAGCKVGSDEIDEDLSTYEKPIIRRIDPGGVIYNRMGFVFNAFSDSFPNESYSLYFNKRRIGSCEPNYWHYHLWWDIPADFLSQLTTTTGTGDFTIDVRITPIQTDISDSFDRYAEYISDVRQITIKRDSSTSFTSPAPVNDLWENSTDPVLRRDSRGYLYLAWRELLNGVYQAFFCYSVDEGANWSQVLNISRSTKEVTKVDMEIDDDGDFYMVWSEQENYFSEVYFSRSLDNGATWWLPRRLSIANENSRNPVIDVDSWGKIYVAWTNYLPEGNVPDYNTLWLASSSDRGNFWQTRLMANSDTVSGEPAIQAGENGNIYIICGALGPGGVYTFYSNDYGNNWHINLVNQSLDLNNGQKTSLRIGTGETLFLAWNTEYTGGHNFSNWIQFMSGANNGAAWDVRQYLDYICNTNGTKAAMTVNGSQVNALMHSGKAPFLLRSPDGGETWSYPEFIPGTTSSLGSVPLDMVTADTGRIYLVFIQKNTVSNQSGTIYFTRSD